LNEKKELNGQRARRTCPWGKGVALLSKKKAGEIT